MSQLVFTQFHYFNHIAILYNSDTKQICDITTQKQKIITFTLLILVDFHTQHKTNSLIQSQALTSQTHGDSRVVI